MFLTFYFFVLGGPFCGNADIHRFLKNWSQSDTSKCTFVLRGLPPNSLQGIHQSSFFRLSQCIWRLIYSWYKLTHWLYSHPISRIPHLCMQIFKNSTVPLGNIIRNSVYSKNAKNWAGLNEIETNFLFQLVWNSCFHVVAFFKAV